MKIKKEINKIKNSKFIEEFKDFALKGNIVDMAIGIIIGGAFSQIVTSLVNDIIMPIVSLIIGKVNFKDLKYVKELGSGLKLELTYGNFIQNVVNFIIIAFCLFVVIKFMNKLQNISKEEIEKEDEKEEKIKTVDEQKLEVLLEIKEMLKNNK